jgi:hypothetical protein
VIFAHFYFLSADLGRAARFLDTHPSVRFDLAPGIEMLYNLSRDPNIARDFFCRYAERIVFGTDISSRNSLEEGRLRAGIIFRWLETQDTFRVPEATDFLLGPPQDGVIHGISLPDEVLSKIYRENLVRLVGAQPRPLDVPRALEECDRLAAIAEALSGRLAAETEAGKVAQKLAHQA